jgi:uncharacterized protein YpbB
LHINGIGKRTADKYGDQLVSIVTDYCREHQVEPQQTPPEPETNNEKKDTRQISYELYRQGKSISEIAEARGLVTNTIEGHLAHYVGLGMLDVSDLVADTKISSIKQAAEKKGIQNLKVIKEHLGDNVSYGEIRMVLESLR